MKNRTFLTVAIISAIMLVSCSPTTLSTLTQTAIVPKTTPTATIIHLTEQPHLYLQEDTVLYNGPGNIDFDPIATLTAGSVIIPLGIYVDFVKVIVSIDGNQVTGYINKDSLGVLPANLPILQKDQVPWKPIYSPTCSPGIYDPSTNKTKISNPGDDVYNFRSDPIHLDAPLRIRIDGLSSIGDGGQFGKIEFSGWRDITTLEIHTNGHGIYVLSFRDSLTDKYKVEIKDTGFESSKTIQIIFDQIDGRSFSIQDANGQELRHVNLESLGLNIPNGLFPDGNVFISGYAGPHSATVIIGLGIGTLADGKITEQKIIDVGLAKLAQNYNITIGSEFNIGSMVNKKYCDIMNRDFNVAVISDFSNKDWWLGPGKYNFAMLDKEVNNAVQHGFRVRASHLIAEGGGPDWLINGMFTREQYIDILHQYIQDVVGHYKGKVQEWSIANEAISRSINGDDFWNKKIGPDYIEMAFRWAREADLNGILIFNDTQNDSVRDSKSRRVIDKMYKTVQDLKAKGVPIDVVGMQMHMLVPWESQTPPKEEDIVNTMQAFGKLGVRIYITEFDVTLQNQPGTKEEKWEFEAKIYKDALTACIESKVCDSFTTWGISDSTSWLTCDDLWCTDPLLNADPLMFDHNFNPKPAYWAVHDTLLNFSKPSAP